MLFVSYSKRSWKQNWKSYKNKKLSGVNMTMNTKQLINYCARKQSMETPWDFARKMDVVTEYVGEKVKLDKGVNYFVLMLEQIGAKPQFSCEGHHKGQGFYIVFISSYELACCVKANGFFAIEIEGTNRFSIRLNNVDSRKDRNYVLRLASSAWEKNLGELDYHRKSKVFSLQ